MLDPSCGGGWIRRSIAPAPGWPDAACRPMPISSPAWRSACRVPLLAWGHYELALLVILLNRLIDGLDGAIARQQGNHALRRLPRYHVRHGVLRRRAVGLCPGQPGQCAVGGLAAGIVRVHGSSFLGRAVLAVQRGEPDDGARGQKSFFHAAGIVEGTETIVAFVLFCLFPDALSLAGRAVRRPLLLDGGGRARSWRPSSGRDSIRVTTL